MRNQMEEVSLRAKEYYRKEIIAKVSIINDERYLARIYAIIKYHKEEKEES